MNKYKLLAIILSLLWLLSAIAAYIYYGIAFVNQHISETASCGAAQINEYSSLILMAFYFFPLLQLIKKYAGRANMKKLILTAKILLVPFWGMLLIMPIALLFMLINQ